jgi:hypothetical protein
MPVFKSCVSHNSKRWGVGETSTHEAEHACRVFAARVVDHKRDGTIEARNKALHLFK